MAGFRTHITVSGLFDWKGGALQGSGTVTVLAGATMNLNADNYANIARHNILDGVTLINAGTAVWTGGVVGGDIVARNGAVIDNTGVFDIQGNRTLIFDGVGAAPTFNNSGLVKKTALAEYSRPRAGGIIGISLDEGDTLIDVALVQIGDDSQEQLLREAAPDLLARIRRQQAFRKGA